MGVLGVMLAAAPPCVRAETCTNFSVDSEGVPRSGNVVWTPLSTPLAFGGTNIHSGSKRIAFTNSWSVKRLGGLYSVTEDGADEVIALIPGVDDSTNSLSYYAGLAGSVGTWVWTNTYATNYYTVTNSYNVTNYHADTSSSFTNLAGNRLDASLLVSSNAFGAGFFGTLYYVGLGDGVMANAPIVEAGSGDPNGVRTAGRGSVYLRSDGGTNTTIYIKESSGLSATGWNPH
jgi:hypothetical protein